MRLQPFLLALALGCAAEDSKTDDTSSNGFGDGSGDEGADMGNLLSQVAEMATEMAEMSAKIAAQQATIAQLEMQMSETLRWETFEHTCAADGGGTTWYETVDSTVAVPEVLHVAWKWGDGDWSTRFESDNQGSTVSTSDGLEAQCRESSDGSALRYQITLGYVR